MKAKQNKTLDGLGVEMPESPRADVNSLLAARMSTSRGTHGSSSLLFFPQPLHPRLASPFCKIGLRPARQDRGVRLAFPAKEADRIHRD